MDRKVLKTLKMVAIFCVIILVVELGYICYRAFYSSEKFIYFDGINAIKNTSDGFITVGSNNNNENHYEKGILTTYSNKMEKSFEKVYNKGYNSAFFGVAVDGDEYVAVGSYEASRKEHQDGVRSGLFIKYDKQGEILFEKSFQVLGNSKFVNVSVQEDGYLVVGQSVYEDMTLGLSDQGGAFLIKYGKDGKELWRSNYGGSKSAIYNDLLVSGDFIYTVGKDASNVGIISKYDMNGNRLLTTNYEFTDGFGFTGITKVDDVLVVCGGKKESRDDMDSNTDAFLVRYTFDLEQIDEVTYHDVGIERYNRVMLDKQGDLVTIGTTASYDKNKNETEINVLSYDGIIGKYKNDLKEVKVEKYGDERDDHFTDFVFVDDYYLVSGYSSYEDGSYLSKFINYSDALKVLEVES